MVKEDQKHDEYNENLLFTKIR